MNDWTHQACIIVCSGPSLTDEQIAQAKAARHQARIIVVNDNWQLIRDADVLYAADRSWWVQYYDRIQTHFRGQLWTCDDRVTRHYPGVNLIDSVVGSGLCGTPNCITVGSTSASQALQLAYLWGSRKITFIGLDCQPTAGRKHWFGDHPPSLNERLPFERWSEELSILAKELAAQGVEVYNSSNETALTCFTRAPLTTLFNLPT